MCWRLRPRLRLKRLGTPSLELTMLPSPETGRPLWQQAATYAQQLQCPWVILMDDKGTNILRFAPNLRTAAITHHASEAGTIRYRKQLLGALVTRLGELNQPGANQFLTGALGRCI
jgi:hypothetical protein